MFSYVEYRRAVRALRIVAIVLGLVLVACVFARLSWSQRAANTDTVTTIERSPTAHITRTKLPAGGTRTVIDDPKKGVYAVVDRRGGSVTRFSMGRPGFDAKVAGGRDSARDVRASPRPRNETVATTVAYTFFDLGTLFSFTVPIGLLAATLLAGPLSKENNGHLELAWTKPVSRERYAVGAMLVDVTAVAVAQVAAAATLLLAALLWEVPKLSFGSLAALHVLYALVAPVAWYACLTAFSTALKRGPGLVLGIGWVVAVVCPSIAATTERTSTPVGRALYTIFSTVSYADPITYMWFRIDAIGTDPARSTVIGLAALAVLAAVYLGLAILQWRRVEA